MSYAGNFYKKVLEKPELAQVPFRVAVLEKYLAEAGANVMRTNTIGRVKSGSWSLDFGIAPDEQTIHIALGLLQNKLPEKEREHWLSHIDDERYSMNYLQTQASPSCMDDGGLRAWGEDASESLFD